MPPTQQPVPLGTGCNLQYHKVTTPMKTIDRNDTPIQLKLPLDMERIIETDDSVYTFNEVLAHMDLKKILCMITAWMPIDFSGKPFSFCDQSAVCMFDVILGYAGLLPPVSEQFKL